MDHSQGFYPEGEEKKRSLKGFYIALSLCLLAIVGVAVVTLFDDETPQVVDTPTTSATGPTAATTAKPVAGTATGVPDTRTTATTAATTRVTTTTTATSDLFVFPVSNVILQPYSDRLIYSETLGEWRTHNGVDFEAAIGQKAKAIADGTVTAVREDPLWGPVIELEHGDKLISRYCGVKPYDVKEGDTVKAGQVIGTVTEIPMEVVDAPHLHLEIIANGNYMDPMTLIRGEAIVKTTASATTTTTEQ